MKHSYKLITPLILLMCACNAPIELKIDVPGEYTSFSRIFSDLRLSDDFMILDTEDGFIGADYDAG